MRYDSFREFRVLAVQYFCVNRYLLDVVYPPHPPPEGDALLLYNHKDNLPSKRIENWWMAKLQFLIGIVHFYVIFLNAIYSNLIAASSFGKLFLVLVTFLRELFRDSIAFVV